MESWVDSRWGDSLDLPLLSSSPEKRISIAQSELIRIPLSAKNSAERILKLLNNKILLAEGLALGIGDTDPVTIERLNLNMQFLSSEDEPEGDITSRYEAAMSLGMIETDPIVQRRIIQLTKQYLLLKLTGKDEKSSSKNNLGVPSAFNQYPLPTDAELNEYLKRHYLQFEKPSRWSFSQLFLDPQKRGNLSSNWFSKVLAQLNEGASFKGDVSILPRDLVMVSGQQISQQFGHDFANSLETLAIDQWLGPIKSSYGTHLVKITDKVSARAPELNEVYNRAVIGWQEENRERLLASHLSELRQSYQVSITKTSLDAHHPMADGNNLTAAEFAQMWRELK